MPDLPTSCGAPLVACSLLIAGFACYIALDASPRLRGADKRLATRWWIAATLAMGTGLWAANFAALLALTLPVALGFGVGLTVLSWLAALAASALALFVASRDKLAWPQGVVIAICASATALEAFFLVRSTRRGKGFRVASAALDRGAQRGGGRRRGKGVGHGARRRAGLSAGYFVVALVAGAGRRDL